MRGSVRQKQVELALEDTSFGVSLADLGQVARMVTERRQWKFGNFIITVNDVTLLVRALYGALREVLEIPHTVGEVELCKQVVEENVGRNTIEMTRRVDEFMEACGKVFQETPSSWFAQDTEGKLAVFFR
jgi:hypothetical protein